MLEVAVDDGVGGAIDEGKDCGRRIGGGVLRERRAAEDEKIGQLPVLEVGRDHGIGGGVSPGGGAPGMGGGVGGGIGKGREGGGWGKRGGVGGGRCLLKKKLK